TCTRSPRVGCRWIWRARVSTSSPATESVMRVLAPLSPLRMCCSSWPGTLIATGSVPRPYTTAGTWPARRTRPAGPEPVSTRGSEVRVMSGMAGRPFRDEEANHCGRWRPAAPSQGATRPPGTVRWLDVVAAEQLADAGVLEDGADGVGDDRRDRQHGEA